MSHLPSLAGKFCIRVKVLRMILIQIEPKNGKNYCDGAPLTGVPISTRLSGNKVSVQFISAIKF